MFENLLQLIKENAGYAIINNVAIPNERNEEAIDETTKGVVNFLKEKASSGNMQDIIGMFHGGANSSMVASLSQNIAGKLGSKFGLNSAQSLAIVQQLIPVVMDKLVYKTNDSSFDLQSIISTLGGNNVAGGLLGKLGGSFGK